MTITGTRRGLTTAQRRSVLRAAAGRWLRPWATFDPITRLDMRPVWCRAVGWLAIDEIGDLRDQCGRIHEHTVRCAP